MTSLVSRCGRAYRGLARAFPRDFRATCGDGLEQLGVDIAPLVWKEQGAFGLVRLFAARCALTSRVFLGMDRHVQGVDDD